MDNSMEAAFPIPCGDTPHGFQGGSYGLTKREYFAGLIAQGLSADNWPDVQINPGVIARDAVKLADALLEALSSEGRS